MAGFCTNCGKEIPDGVAFCTECGTKAPEQAPAPQTVSEAPTMVETPQQPQPTQQVQYAQPEPQQAQQVQYAPPAPQPTQQVQYAQPAPQPTQQAQYTQPAPQQTAPINDKKSDTVGTAYYFFMQLLFSIPIIGFIVCIITACSGNNKSKRNFSKAYLIWVIVGIILSIVGIVSLISAGQALIEYINTQLGGEAGSLSELIEQFFQVN